jgi:hypothetical protein
VHGRQVFVAVAQVVLAVLGGGVTLGLYDLGDARIIRTKAEGRAWQADLG